MRNTMPAMPAERIPRVRSDIGDTTIARWDRTVRAASDDDDRSISIYDVIGAGYGDEGVTVRSIAAALRRIGRGSVTVNVNSPGGDFFDGVAIYNLLRDHDGAITVRIVGMAASVASVIAMAGDRIEIAESAFLMLHNAWVLAAGNRNDLREYAGILDKFDGAMRDLYVARTGVKADAVAEMMDAETWIGSADAIEMGFADALMVERVAHAKASTAPYERHAEDMLTAAGVSRNEAKRIISQFKTGLRDAAGNGARDAADDDGRDAVDISKAVAQAASITAILEIRK